MAKRPNVPKFGEWNNQDNPFTAAFDNARTNKLRAGLYDSVESSENKPQARAPRNPKPIRDDTPRAPRPTERSKFGPPRLADGQCGGGLGNQRQQQAPRPMQPIPNLRGGSNGKGVTIPPFPGSVGAGESLSYTQIFDQVKEERRDGFRSSGNTPSPINSRQTPSPSSSKSMVCCFPWCRKGSKY